MPPEERDRVCRRPDGTRAKCDAEDKDAGSNGEDAGRARRWMERDSTMIVM